MPRLRQVVIDSTHARMSAEFWRQLLGLEYRAGHEQPNPGDDDLAGDDWLNLRSPDGSPLLAFQQVGLLRQSTWPEPEAPQQLHLDLTVRTRTNWGQCTSACLRSEGPCDSIAPTILMNRCGSTQTSTATPSASSSPTNSPSGSATTTCASPHSTGPLCAEQRTHSEIPCATQVRPAR